MPSPHTHPKALLAAIAGIFCLALVANAAARAYGGDPSVIVLLLLVGFPAMVVLMANGDFHQR